MLASVTSPPDYTNSVFWAIGLAGQALFMLRMFTQWWASERAGKSVAPASFWWLSIAGTVLLLAYAWHTGDPIFLIGPTLNLFLYIRNLMLHRKPGAALRAAAIMVPLGTVLLLSGFAVAYMTAEQKDIIRIDASPWWLIIGLTGTALWTLRFPVQWIIAERTGRSTLPPVFWWMSLGGALLLTAYAAYKPDVIFVLAYAISPLPIVRNLMLIYRRTAPAAAEPEDTPQLVQPDAVVVATPETR
ncbi:MAG: lipid-A-disaccharide synthase N-terminal domain-containing protein [Planctomycetes bacterium]|nr:lipid-A-disaccharide synthase N-terminal domain-containing protein [Planctomycetota bacterium]MCW8137043.1 lipid-A-disaccharide synthase N-terminal domain-containing protein [Planctomycetota bacterium]